jgi:hypothetical protein
MRRREDAPTVIHRTNNALEALRQRGTLIAVEFERVMQAVFAVKTSAPWVLVETRVMEAVCDDGLTPDSC